jgi:hypothetical protein
MFLGVERDLCIGLTTLPPSVRRLSKKCANPYFLIPYTPPRPATGIDLLFTFTFNPVLQQRLNLHVSFYNLDTDTSTHKHPCLQWDSNRDREDSSCLRPHGHSDGQRVF